MLFVIVSKETNIELIIIKTIKTWFIIAKSEHFIKYYQILFCAKDLLARNKLLGLLLDLRILHSEGSE